MDTKTTMSITEARKRIFQIANTVSKLNKYYTFTDNGRPKVVMMSAQEFDSWQETLEVAKDMSDLKMDILETENDIKTGDFKKYITLEDILKEEGFVKINKKIKRNEILSNSKTKGKKRIRKDS